MPAARKSPKADELLTPAEARRRLTSLLRELEAQPARRFPIGVGEVKAVLVSPELLERLERRGRKARANLGVGRQRQAPAVSPAVDPPPPPPVDGDDSPDGTVKRLVKRVIKTVRD